MGRKYDISKIIVTKMHLLTILEEGRPRKFSSGNKRTVLCLCDCGNKREVYLNWILSGVTKSCIDCLKHVRPKIDVSKFKALGMNWMPERRCWLGMKARCINIKNPAYKNYGGGGITICQEWVDSFEVFLRDMGLRPSAKHSIERIDNNLGYNKTNCRWATKTEQNRNKRGVIIIEYKGVSKCLSEWASIHNISKYGLNHRIFKLKWDIEKALTHHKMKNKYG